MKIVLNNSYNPNSVLHDARINSVQISLSLSDKISKLLFSAICNDISQIIGDRNIIFSRQYNELQSRKGLFMQHTINAEISFFTTKDYFSEDVLSRVFTSIANRLGCEPVRIQYQQQSGEPIQQSFKAQKEKTFCGC